jgi:hypothetical protein
MKHLGHEVESIRDTPTFKSWNLKDGRILSQNKRLAAGHPARLYPLYRVILKREGLLPLVKHIRNSTGMDLYDIKLLLRSLDLWVMDYPWKRVS